ncbi:hypothetical protein ACLB2K_038539 [Fragaria x ananassa]
MTVSFQQPPPPQSQPQPQPEQPSQPQPQQPPQPQRTIRKLIVEVVDARDLLPKDGQGSSSAYMVADFDGQRKPLEFVVSDPDNMDYEELEIEVLNDKRYGNSGTARKNHFLGRVKLYGTQFSKRGDEGLVEAEEQPEIFEAYAVSAVPFFVFAKMIPVE